MPAIRLPTTDAECRALRQWAETAPIQVAEAAPPQVITQHLLLLAAVLPAKAVDQQIGALRSALYKRLLTGRSEAELAFLVDRASATLAWFPTPQQCLDILADYRAPEAPQHVALRLCQTYAADAFDRWLDNLRAGQPIGDVPEQWKRIAVEQGVMRRLVDGSMVSRALYHGPYRPTVQRTRLPGGVAAALMRRREAAEERIAARG